MSVEQVGAVRDLLQRIDPGFGLYVALLGCLAGLVGAVKGMADTRPR